MLHHIFKIIWNERKGNIWILLEFIFVFCILWFCVDVLWYLGGKYIEPKGFDTEHVYLLEMNTREIPESERKEKDPYNRYESAMLALERIKSYPGVESAALSIYAIPYPYKTGTAAYGYQIESDSSNIIAFERRIMPDYLDVFKIKLEDGKVFEWGNEAHKNNILITGDDNNKFGSYSISAIRTIKEGRDELTVTGYLNRIKQNDFFPYQNVVYRLMRNRNVNLATNEISIRVRPEADVDFVERFTKDMQSQLDIGYYYMVSITPFKTLMKNEMLLWKFTRDLNSILGIIAFVVINIFLGIIGTFWFRVQARKQDIGLRIVLGSSKRKVKKLFISETFLLLFLSSIIGTVICINIRAFDLITSLGLPYYNREGPARIEQDVINYLVTFGFILIVSLLAIWYPVKQASNTQPAEVLHNE